jgi:hypothetical protein
MRIVCQTTRGREVADLKKTMGTRGFIALDRDKWDIDRYRA